MSGRAVQLDGLRAIAMIAIAWDHWTADILPRFFPYEVFLFLFLVLTGHLITGSLLRERDRKEGSGRAWRREAMRTYQIRRGLRILAPYYVALLFAWIVRAPDVWPALGWYFFHLSNIHMAIEGSWPPGTSHFWSLAMQQQFYLIWPFVIWFVPRQRLAWVIGGFAAIAPVSRIFHGGLETWFAWPQLLTWASFDYFGIGGLLALAVHRGMSLESAGLRLAAGVSLLGYLVIFACHAAGWPTFGLRIFQQTLLSIALCGLVAAATVGFEGGIRRFLEHPGLQRVGQLSYGVYLYHNLAPFAVGKIVPWVFWNAWFDTFPGILVRIALFAGVTWLLTLASWRWIESPLQQVRARISPGV